MVSPHWALICRTFSSTRSTSLSLPGVSTSSAPYAWIAFCRSRLMPSGMTMMTRYPFAAPTIAVAIPVLPVVPSIRAMPGRSSPRRSASAIMNGRMRSLRLPLGPKYSSLAYTAAGRSPITRRMRTSGVRPAVSRMFSAALRRRSQSMARSPSGPSRSSPARDGLLPRRALPRRLNLVHDHLQRGGGPAVARVPLLRTVGDRNQQVDVGAQVEVVARLGLRLLDPGGAAGGDRSVHEDVEGVRDFGEWNAVGPERPLEVAPAVRRPADSVAERVGVLTARPADQIVHAAGIRRDGHEPRGFRRVQMMAGREQQRAVEQLRVLGGELVDEIAQVEADEIRHLLALEVDDPAHLPRPHRKRRPSAGWDDLVKRNQ